MSLEDLFRWCDHALSRATEERSSAAPFMGNRCGTVWLVVSYWGGSHLIIRWIIAAIVHHLRGGKQILVVPTQSTILTPLSLLCVPSCAVQETDCSTPSGEKLPTSPMERPHGEWAIGQDLRRTSICRWAMPTTTTEVVSKVSWA